MADPKLGTKRQCPSCGARFYDLNKKPNECPKCEHVFEPEVLLKPRKPRAVEKAKEVAQAQAAAAEQKRAETEKAAGDSKVAALAPAPAQPSLAALSTGAPQADVTKSVQSELRRVWRSAKETCL